MQEKNFYKVGTFNSFGELVLGDPSLFRDKKNKVAAIPFPEGVFDVVACSLNYQLGDLPQSAMVAFAIKPQGKKLNFKNMIEIQTGNFELGTGNVSVINHSAWKKLTNKDCERMVWEPLAKPDSTELMGREAEEYAWFETIIMREHYITCGGLNYDSRFWVYQGSDFILVSFQPLNSDWSKYSFHPNLKSFYTARAEIIRGNFIKHLALLIKAERFSTTDPQEIKAAIESIYGWDFSPKTKKILTEKIKEACV